MSRSFSYPVPPEEDGAKLQDFLRRQGYSRRLIIDLKRGGIAVDGAHRRMVDPVRAGETVTVDLAGGENHLIPNPSLQVGIAYEDDDLIVFDKPAGMTVHPCSLHYNDSLGNFFAAHYEGISFRPTTRLDRDTTGLCLVAKHTLAAGKVIPTLEKTYYAVAEGEVYPDEGVIDAPLIRVPGSIITRQVAEDGQRAVTHYRVCARKNGFTLLAITLETGRTHQIRVHFSHIGHPLAGDTLYGGQPHGLTRQALHCGELRFLHPADGRPMVVRSELPQELAQLLK